MATVVEPAFRKLRLLKEREVDPGQLDEIGCGFRVTADDDQCPGVVISAVTVLRTGVGVAGVLPNALIVSKSA